MTLGIDDHLFDNFGCPLAVGLCSLSGSVIRIYHYKSNWLSVLSSILQSFNIISIISIYSSTGLRSTKTGLHAEMEYMQNIESSSLVLRRAWQSGTAVWIRTHNYYSTNNQETCPAWTDFTVSLFEVNGFILWFLMDTNLFVLVNHGIATQLKFVKIKKGFSRHSWWLV